MVWKPFMKVHTHENLDQALVQRQNMAVHKYKNLRKFQPVIIKAYTVYSVLCVQSRHCECYML